MRATLSEVLTADAYDRMIGLARRYEQGAAAAIERHSLPWTVTRLGCRVEYMFQPEAPRSGAEASAAIIEHEPLDKLMHLYMLNRGILFTPFHMMALISPATTAADVDAHTAAFDEATADLAG